MSPTKHSSSWTPVEADNIRSLNIATAIVAPLSQEQAADRSQSLSGPPAGPSERNVVRTHRMSSPITRRRNKEPFRLSDDVPDHDLPSEADDWHQLRASWWIVVPTLASVIAAVLGGLAVASATHFTSVSAGATVPLWVLGTAFFVSCVALLCVAMFYLLRLTAKLRRPLEQRERRNAWVSRQQSWAATWSQLLGEESALPCLVSEMSLPDMGDPDTAPMLNTLVFAKPAGFESMQAVQLASKLAPAVQENMVHVAPGVAPFEGDYDTWSYFTITYTNRKFSEWASCRHAAWRNHGDAWGVSIDGTSAYLDASLDPLVRSFLLKRNLTIAMQEFGMRMPLIPRNMTDRSERDDNGIAPPPYMMLEFLLCNGVTPQALQRNSQALAARLHVGWLRFDMDPKSDRAVLHACPTHPDRAKFGRGLESFMPKEIMRLDFEHWMRSLGLVSSDGWAGPRVARPTDGRSLKVTLPLGVTPDRVRRVLPQLEQATGRRLGITDMPRGSDKMTLLLLG